MKILLYLIVPLFLFSCNPFGGSQADSEKKEQEIKVFRFTVKDNPEEMIVGTTYYVNVESDYYTPKEIVASVNNGKIVNSLQADWRFYVTPDKAGEIRISVHFKQRKTGEVGMESVYYKVKQAS